MKTILTTTLAIALMVFAFNTDAFAKGEKDDSKSSPPPPKPKIEIESEPVRCSGADAVRGCGFAESESNDGLGDREVADSGSEGPTSAAQESDY